jgi:glycosyltransferase involved in cell wall biosynthesis
MTVATELVLRAVRDEFCVIHLDIADRRPISTMGRIDLRNVMLAAYHGVKYLWLLLRRKPDIVYMPVAQDRLAFLRDSLFLIPARLLSKQVVVHLHGGYFATFYRLASPPMRSLIRYCLGRSARAIVLGTSLENMFEGILPPERVRVIPNGIPDYFGDMRRHHSNNGHRRTILFLSTLVKEKGILDVIKALPTIANLVPDVRAVFAGEWYRAEDKRAAQEIVREFNLQSHVEFLGSVIPPQKNEVLREADLFVMPSKNEGQPFAILEAMAAGLPVVSTNVGCIPETVINGVNGFIVKPGNADELACRIVSLLADGDLRRRMGEAGRSRFLEHYSLDRFSTQLRELLREVAA